MQVSAKDIGIKWEQVQVCSLNLAEKKWFKTRKNYYSQKKKFTALQKEFQQSYIDTLDKEAHVPKDTNGKTYETGRKTTIYGKKKHNKYKEKESKILCFVQLPQTKRV